jgi:GYD domain
MTLYMTQFAYTPKAWTAFTKHPEDRTKAVQALAQKLGCKFEALYYSLGEYDGRHGAMKPAGRARGRNNMTERYRKSRSVHKRMTIRHMGNVC